MKTHISPKLVMGRAWAEARRGQAMYGGKVRQYLREALRLVWADLKADPVARVASEMIAEMRSGKRPPVYAAPYSIRNRGNRAVTRWYAGQALAG